MPEVIVIQYGINIGKFPDAILHCRVVISSRVDGMTGKTAARKENIKYLDQEMLKFSDVDGYTEIQKKKKQQFSYLC